MKAYQTFSGSCAAEWKDQGSKFLAYGYPIEEEQDVKRILSELKSQYPDATHHCYAFKLGNAYRASDDGEPGNSAGLPIYRQILSAGLDYVLVVVVRYFGGKKLGIPGLIKAYGESAKLCISSGTITEKHPVLKYQITADAENEYRVYEICSRCSATPVKDGHSFWVTIDFKMVDLFQTLCEKFPNLQVELRKV